MSTPVSHQRLKLAAIPVLAAVLWMVLPKTPNAASDEPLVKLNRDVPTSTRSGSSKPGEAKLASDMPVIGLDDALRFDPFAVPKFLQQPVEEVSVVEESVEPAPSQVAEEIKTPIVSIDHLQSLEVSAVVHGPRGPAAIVGSKTVRIGDLFEPNVRVVEIQSDRVLLRVENGKPAKTGETPVTQ